MSGADFVPGLAGVVAARSAIGWINGLEGILRYRGIAIEELAANCSFEEVSYLLLLALFQLKLDTFDQQLKEYRALPSGLVSLIKDFQRAVIHGCFTDGCRRLGHLFSSNGCD